MKIDIYALEIRIGCLIPQKRSQKLCEMLDSGVVQPYLYDECCRCVIKCFLDPQFFCEEKRLPSSRSSDGRTYGATECDPIYDFFMSDDTNSK